MSVRLHTQAQKFFSHVDHAGEAICQVAWQRQSTLNPFNYAQSILKQIESKDCGMYALDARRALTSEMKTLGNGPEAAKNLYQV